MDGSLMDEVLLVLPFILWLQSAAMPLRHPLSRVPLSLQPPHFVAVAGYAALPIGRMTQENPSLDFLGYCRSRGLLHVAKSRLHALFVYWQERLKHACKEKFLHGSIFLGKKQIRSLSPSKGTSLKKSICWQASAEVPALSLCKAAGDQFRVQRKASADFQ